MLFVRLSMIVMKESTVNKGYVYQYLLLVQATKIAKHTICSATPRPNVVSIAKQTMTAVAHFIVRPTCASEISALQTSRSVTLKPEYQPGLYARVMEVGGSQNLARMESFAKKEPVLPKCVSPSRNRAKTVRLWFVWKTEAGSVHLQLVRQTNFAKEELATNNSANPEKPYAMETLSKHANQMGQAMKRKPARRKSIAKKALASRTLVYPERKSVMATLSRNANKMVQVFKKFQTAQVEPSVTKELAQSKAVNRVRSSVRGTRLKLVTRKALPGQTSLVHPVNTVNRALAKNKYALPTKRSVQVAQKRKCVRPTVHS